MYGSQNHRNGAVAFRLLKTWARERDRECRDGDQLASLVDDGVGRSRVLDLLYEGGNGRVIKMWLEGELEQRSALAGEADVIVTSTF